MGNMRQRGHLRTGALLLACSLSSWTLAQEPEEFLGFAFFAFYIPWLDWPEGNAQAPCGGDLLYHQILQFGKCYQLPGSSKNVAAGGTGYSFMLDKIDAVTFRYYKYSKVGCISVDRVLDEPLVLDQCNGALGDFLGQSETRPYTWKLYKTTMSMIDQFPSGLIFKWYSGSHWCEDPSYFRVYPAGACQLNITNAMGCDRLSGAVDHYCRLENLVPINNRYHHIFDCAGNGRAIVKKHYYNGGAHPSAWRNAKYLDPNLFREPTYGNPTRCLGSVIQQESFPMDYCKTDNINSWKAYSCATARL